MTKILACDIPAGSADLHLCSACRNSVSAENSFCSAACERIFDDAFKQEERDFAENLREAFLEEEEKLMGDSANLFYGKTVSIADLIRYFGM